MPWSQSGRMQCEENGKRKHRTTEFDLLVQVRVIDPDAACQRKSQKWLGQWWEDWCVLTRGILCPPSPHARSNNNLPRASSTTETPTIPTKSPYTRPLFASCITRFTFDRWPSGGGWKMWWASKGGLDHEDWIRLSFVLHRPSRPRSAYDLNQIKRGWKVYF
jgi:hypothetical protein